MTVHLKSIILYAFFFVGVTGASFIEQLGRNTRPFSNCDFAAPPLWCRLVTQSSLDCVTSLAVVYNICATLVSATSTRLVEA